MRAMIKIKKVREIKMSGIRKSQRAIQVDASCGHSTPVLIPPGELGVKGKQYIAEAKSKPCYECRLNKGGRI